MKECLNEAVKQKYSLLLIQEPYVGSKAHVTIGSNFRVIQRITQNTSKPVRAAIVLIDPNIQVIDNPDLVSEDIVGTTIKIGERKIGILNMYLHGEADIHVDLHKIRDIIQKLNTTDTIIAGDVNAKSFWWGSDIEDKRGIELAETLAELDLNVLNEGNTPTFRTLRQGIWCTSIVDVTACSTSILDKIHTWRITEDHIANININEDIENVVKEYTQAISTACEKSIPSIPSTTKTQDKGLWWTPELIAKKKEVIRIRKRIRKANARRKKFVIEEYNAAKEDFKTSIEKAITQSWMDFCSRQERENVWQCSYRIIKHCSRKSHDQLLRLNETGGMLTPEDSAKLLADTFYPRTQKSLTRRNRKK
ncbi:endonuclease-reverse transcriptase domain-containing protein [Phthorimaea operculella]|nr:endonuclease-reverse transcriptase domain-containing protein [Phthorimaea operculella]